MPNYHSPAMHVMAKEKSVPRQRSCFQCASGKVKGDRTRSCTACGKVGKSDVPRKVQNIVNNNMRSINPTPLLGDIPAYLWAQPSTSNTEQVKFNYPDAQSRSSSEASLFRGYQTSDGGSPLSSDSEHSPNELTPHFLRSSEFLANVLRKAESNNDPENQKPEPCERCRVLNIECSGLPPCKACVDAHDQSCSFDPIRSLTRDDLIAQLKLHQRLIKNLTSANDPYDLILQLRKGMPVGSITS